MTCRPHSPADPYLYLSTWLYNPTQTSIYSAAGVKLSLVPEPYHVNRMQSEEYFSFRIFSYFSVYVKNINFKTNSPVNPVFTYSHSDPRLLLSTQTVVNRSGFSRDSVV